MGTKMKGLLKGLRYISQIFDDEEEQEIQIGYPTDVKHVAHIGWDGPSVDSPSWMKDYDAPQTVQSAPLNINGGPPKDPPEAQWVSQDSGRKGNGAQKSLPKSSKKHQAMGDGSPGPGSPTAEKSSKHRQARRHSSKDSSEGSKLKDSSEGGSTSRNLPDIPKKSRRKKSKESGGSGGGSSRSSRNKTTMGPSTSASDHGHHDDGLLSVPKSELCQTSSLRPLIEEVEENGHK